MQKESSFQEIRLTFHLALPSSSSPWNTPFIGTLPNVKKTGEIC